MAGNVFGFYFFGPREDRLSAVDRAGLQARRIAVDLLTAVLKKWRPFDEVLEQAATEDRYTALEARDRAFVRAIAMVTLRRHGQLSALIANFIEKPLPAKRGQLDEILLSAAAQLVFLESAPHAVINLAVFQVRGDPQAKRFAGLANAVLRRVSEKGKALTHSQDAARLNTPDWLWQRWTNSYGAEATQRLAEQHLYEPPLDLTVKSDAEGWAKRLGGIALPTGSVRLAAKGRIEELEGFQNGEWWVQDAAAALPARLLGDVKEKLVADLCAAPGGKSAQLAHSGAKLWAVDISSKRLNRVSENLKRLTLEAEIVEADAGSWTPPEPLDAILLDAPCSATGTIRRHPDIVQVKKAADIGELAKLQAKLLRHAIMMLKPGGMLVYCTCSLEPEEGPEQIRRLLDESSDVERVPIDPDEIAGRIEWLNHDGDLRTLPHFLHLSDPDLSGMDGFYAARLRKKA